MHHYACSIEETFLKCSLQIFKKIAKKCFSELDIVSATLTIQRLGFTLSTSIQVFVYNSLTPNIARNTSDVHAYLGEMLDRHYVHNYICNTFNHTIVCHPSGKD